MGVANLGFPPLAFHHNLKTTKSLLTWSEDLTKNNIFFADTHFSLKNVLSCWIFKVLTLKLSKWHKKSMFNFTIMKKINYESFITCSKYRLKKNTRTVNPFGALRKSGWKLLKLLEAMNKEAGEYVNMWRPFLLFFHSTILYQQELEFLTIKQLKAPKEVANFIRVKYQSWG